VAIVAAGAVFATAVTAGADAPAPITNTGSAVVNPDGSITVTVQGTWTWPRNKDCNEDRYAAGWAVDWNDASNPGHFVATLDGHDYKVGTTTPDDNQVYFYDTPPRCGTYDGTASNGNWGPLTHTYPAGTDISSITPCVVTYDIHGKDSPDAKDLVAGEPFADADAAAPKENHNKDNSLQDPAQGHDAECGSIVIDPDVSVVKTGPDVVTVGTSYTYDIKATNTGIVPAENVTITDVVPSNVDFVSASAPCTYDTGTRTVTCNVGTLAPGGDASVTITVMPLTPGEDIVNTAVVTPDDETPGDNTSTWTIPGINVLPANVERPVVTPVVAAPTFTG
jgi:uncharacterized repeat protein (TIGR01451 family)